MRCIYKQKHLPKKFLMKTKEKCNKKLLEDVSSVKSEVFKLKGFGCLITDTTNKCFVVALFLPFFPKLDRDKISKREELRNFICDFFKLSHQMIHSRHSKRQFRFDGSTQIDHKFFIIKLNYESLYWVSHLPVILPPSNPKILWLRRILIAGLPSSPSTALVITYLLGFKLRFLMVLDYKETSKCSSLFRTNQIY